MTQAGALVLDVLFKIAGVATALLCVRAGLIVTRGAALGSSHSVAEGVMSMFGVAAGALITFKSPEIAQAVLQSAGGGGQLAGGPFGDVVNQILRWVQRVGIVVATVGFVWHGTWALVGMFGGGSTALGELPGKYVALSLSMIALWKVPEIVHALEGAFTSGF